MKTSLTSWAHLSQTLTSSLLHSCHKGITWSSDIIHSNYILSMYNNNYWLLRRMDHMITWITIDQWGEQFTLQVMMFKLFNFSFNIFNFITWCWRWHCTPINDHQLQVIILCISLPEGWGSCDPGSVLLPNDLPSCDLAESTGNDVLVSLTAAMATSCSFYMDNNSNYLVHHQ